MILTDYFYPEKDLSWDLALSCGVRYGVIRLPDTDFDVTSLTEMRGLYDKFTAAGIKPLVVEPMPNHLHDSIKRGDEKRDESIEKVIQMLGVLDQLDIRMICFNFMANIGWFRTTSAIPARGGARVTGFRLADFREDPAPITAEALWENYEYFLRAVLPYAERYHIRLALHPDDPPLPRLGAAERIFVSASAIRRGLELVPSDYLGLTFCQANFHMMGEDIYQLIPEWKDKIFFVHFRNVRGTKTDFSETFHDDGEIQMQKALRCYRDHGVDVPIRVDHVPTYPLDEAHTAGYGAVGRLFAIGYLKGLLEGLEE